MVPGVLPLHARKSRERMDNMEWMSMEMIKSGLVAGVSMAAISAVAVMMMGTLAHESEGILRMAGQWGVVTVVFGVVAAFAFLVLDSTVGIGATGYLYLALGMAVTLTVLEFLPLYGGSFAPHWQTYAVLNFTYAVGFGLLVPRLMG
jgi:hypothetical protein